MEDFSNGEPESMFEQHEPGRHVSPELCCGRAKAAMDNTHRNECGRIPVLQNLQKQPGAGIGPKARVCKALIWSTVCTLGEPGTLQIPRPHP